MRHKASTKKFSQVLLVLSAAALLNRLNGFLLSDTVALSLVYLLIKHPLDLAKSPSPVALDFLDFQLQDKPGELNLPTLETKGRRGGFRGAVIIEQRLGCCLHLGECACAFFSLDKTDAISTKLQLM